MPFAIGSGSCGGPHSERRAQVVRQRMEDAVDLYFGQAAQHLTGQATGFQMGIDQFDALAAFDFHGRLWCIHPFPPFFDWLWLKFPAPLPPPE